LSRYRESVCRQCRREGTKLFLKGERCLSSKCAIERRNYPPGQHGQRMRKISDYGVQLREKQKVKRIYHIMEKQFRNYFKKAEKTKGITGEILLQFLERRLDNVVYRCGFASSRSGARQLVLHGHVTVNGRAVNIPSYLVKAGQTLQVREKSRELPMVKDALDAASKRGFPQWMTVDTTQVVATFLSIPSREEIALPVQEQLIVELYSK
jgi:small subunit ribosomal protein S4